MNTEDNQKCQVVIIRHAQSEFNLAQENFGGYAATRYQHAEDTKIKFSPSLFDAGITEKGYQQTERGRDESKDLNVKLVIVSPFRRALETCWEIFKEHKNKPQIVVDPLFREMLLSSCDIGSRILDSQQTFRQFNFDFIKNYENPLLWVLDELKDEQKKQEIIQKIKSQCQGDKEYQETGHEKLLQYMESIYPVQLEQQKDTNERSMRQKQRLRELAKEYNIQEGEIVAVVGHSRNLQAFSATKFDENTYEPIDSIWLENCQCKTMEV